MLRQTLTLSGGKDSYRRQCRQVLICSAPVYHNNNSGVRQRTGLSSLENPLECCQRESSFFCEFLWLHLEGRQHLGQVIGR